MPQGCPCWGWGQGWGGVERQAKTQGEVGYGRQASGQTRAVGATKGSWSQALRGREESAQRALTVVANTVYSKARCSGGSLGMGSRARKD